MKGRKQRKTNYFIYYIERALLFRKTLIFFITTELVLVFISYGLVSAVYSIFVVHFKYQTDTTEICFLDLISWREKLSFARDVETGMR